VGQALVRRSVWPDLLFSLIIDMSNRFSYFFIPSRFSRSIALDLQPRDRNPAVLLRFVYLRTARRFAVSWGYFGVVLLWMQEFICFGIWNWSERGLHRRRSLCHMWSSPAELYSSTCLISRQMGVSILRLII
jgi:hypothetical protein